MEFTEQQKDEVISKVRAYYKEHWEIKKKFFLSVLRLTRCVKKLPILLDALGLVINEIDYEFTQECFVAAYLSIPNEEMNETL